MAGVTRARSAPRWSAPGYGCTSRRWVRRA